MFTYWLVFLFFAIFAMIGKARIPIIANYPHKLNIDFMWLFIIIFLTVFIGFRFEVGGDWGAYLMYYDSFSGIYLRDAFNITSDPGYILINWASSELGWGIYGVNTICGFIFALGLAIFCRNLPRPLLALLAAIPYLLIVVGMGYSRQGVALGFAMMGFVALGREKKLLFIFLIFLATAFHKTAIVMLPIAALAATKNRFWLIIWTGALGVLSYVTVFSDSFDRLYLYYVEHSYQSEGALIRLLMLLLPSILILLWPHRFTFTVPELSLWRVCAFISIGLFALLFISNASTAVDRIALYMLPIQLVIFSYLPEIFGQKGEARQWIVISIIIYFGLVLLVWSMFSDYSVFWKPYQNILLKF